MPAWPKSILTQLKDWHVSLDAEKIAWATFDRENESMNALGRRPLQELEEIISFVEMAENKDEVRGLVFLSAKKNNFIAGADIHEFKHVTTAEQAIELVSTVNALFERIENLRVPVIAAIHGYCLGGGLELALACHYRIADREEGTRIGFPEVRLGIIPGFNGSVRALYRGGALGALPPMLQGKQLKATAARRAGYVDQLVKTHHSLRWAARKAVLQNRKPRKMRLMQRMTLWAPFRGYIAGKMRTATAKKVRQEHYPAPFDLIELYEKYGGSRKAMKQAETRYFGPLMASEQSRNLRRVFFLSENMKKQAREYSATERFRPRRIHVVGAGVMGADIAAWCAFSGMEVTLQDISDELIQKGREQAKTFFKKRLRNPMDVKIAMRRLIADPAGKGAHHADLVIEAIIEDEQIKKNLFADLEQRVKPDCLLATNTSSIPIEKIASGMKQPERLVGLHFFNPVTKMPLVEVIQGKASTRVNMARGCDFVTSIRKYPVVVKSAPGFLVNRVLAPYMMEAITRLDSGYKAEDLDEAALRFGMPVGPIELADLVGLDVMLSVSKTLGFPMTGNSRFEKLIADGKLGKKTGHGFYKWSKGKAVKKEGQMSEVELDKLSRQLITPLLHECKRCLDEGIVASADLIDGGVIMGTGFAPFRGGPLHYLEKIEALPSGNATETAA